MARRFEPLALRHAPLRPLVRAQASTVDRHRPGIWCKARLLVLGAVPPRIVDVTSSAPVRFADEGVVRKVYNFVDEGNSYLPYSDARPIQPALLQ